jgi:hypothetical protein
MLGLMLGLMRGSLRGLGLIDFVLLLIVGVE